MCQPARCSVLGFLHTLAQTREARPLITARPCTHCHCAAAPVPAYPLSCLQLCHGRRLLPSEC
jgi:hypothetical protein